ncbi:MAG: thioesterase [Oscillospiraceae bacterium]|nr:thioesterase [Oscillospiraceae bacterium]
MAFFEDSFTLSASEADLHRRMKLSAALRHMQDAASRHLDALGYPYEKLMASHQVFLLSRMEVLFEGSPQPEQQVTVRTRPHPPKGVFFLRETQLTADGTAPILGKAAWILADYETHQVLRPSSFGWAYPFDPVDFDNAIARQRIPEPADAAALGTRPIRYSDLDGNRHVNNAVYGDMICDFLPAVWMKGRPIRKATLLYEHEAFLGDELRITGCQIGPDSWYLGGHRGEERCFAAEVVFARP